MQSTRIRGRLAAAAVVALAVMGCGAAPAGAAAGDLDPSFSGDGLVSVPSAGAFVARAVAVQPDGRLVVAGASCEPDPTSGDGTCLSDGASSFRIARFTPDGGLDPEFGAGGLVTTPVGSGRSQARDVLVLPSGAIVAGGAARDQAGRDVLALVRYDARGALDPTFGTGGRVLQPVGDGFAAIAGLAPGPGDTVLATGQAGTRMLVARFTAGGSLDPTFGTGGTVITGPAYGYGLGLAAGPDDAVVAAGIAGTSSSPASYRFGEVRLGPGGLVDGGFGGAGFAQQLVGTSSSFANAAASMADGGWIAAGAGTLADGRQGMALVRGGPRGTPVPAWTSLVSSGAGAVAADVVGLPDGRAIAVGQVTPEQGGLRFGAARVDAAGRLDATFGSGGFATAGWDRYPFARATGGALQRDGRLVMAGLGCAGGHGDRCRGGTAVLLLARLQADPPPGDPGPTPTPAPSGDTTKPRGRLTRVPRRITVGALRRHGLKLRIKASERVRANVRLTGRRRHGKRPVTLAHVRRQRAERSVALRLRAWPTPLRRVRRGPLLLEARLTDRAGNAITVRTHVVLR